MMQTDDAIRVRKIAAERGLTSCMNDTKWREICDAFGSWSPVPAFRIQDLLAPDEYVSDWDTEWYYHPRPYVSIRWLEVRLSPTDVPRAIEMCKTIRAAVETTGAGVRIWGWFGSLDRPKFA